MSPTIPSADASDSTVLTKDEKKGKCKKAQDGIATDLLKDAGKIQQCLNSIRLSKKQKTIADYFYFDGEKEMGTSKNKIIRMNIKAVTYI